MGKLFAKILALRLGPLFPEIIGLEQVGFMPCREAKDYVTKALFLIHLARSQDVKGFLLSTDAERAFDRVAWDFMMAVCRHVELRSHMLYWISAMNPSAK